MRDYFATRIYIEASALPKPRENPSGIRVAGHFIRRHLYPRGYLGFSPICSAMIDTFLTSFDPSDLPGSSVDPLGFERGYLFLADKILPGMTNVASKPRYFALLCAGIYLNLEDQNQTPQQVLEARRKSILRLERFWALANVLASGPEGAGGVRGVSYARKVADELSQSSATKVDARYELLSRQIQYGGIGMYGVVADGMRFINRDSLSLTPDLGEPTAEAFIAETSLPGSLRRAVQEDGDVGVSTLREWGERAHVDGAVGANEGRRIGQALLSNPVRCRMAELLRQHRPKEGVSELFRLDRIGASLKKGEANGDLGEAIRCIVAYENCFRLASLAFERLLWVCKRQAAATVKAADLQHDPVIELVIKQLPAAVSRFNNTVNGSVTDEFRHNLLKLDDVNRFLSLVCESSKDTQSLLAAIVERHSDVQSNKFDGGRRKMPWLEMKGDKISLQITRVGGLSFEATEPDDIVAHPYRLGAADAMIKAAEANSS